MEKKLTDEEIVKAHKTCQTRKGCIGCPYTKKGMNCNIKNDIHRLQDENKRLSEKNGQCAIKTKCENTIFNEACLTVGIVKALGELEKQKNENAELQKQVDEYFKKAYFYYQKCKAYGIENFYDEELEPKPAKEGKTITFPKFKEEEVE